MRLQVEQLVPQAEAALGGEIDILVNNAGVTRDMLFARMSDEDWDLVLTVNLTAAMRLSRAVLRGMMRKRHGRIVSISSVVGVTGNAGQANYAASKAGLIGMTKSLAAEIASRNVTVNCVAPGFTASAMTEALNEKQQATILERVPAKRLGTPDEIAGAVGLSGLGRGGLRHRPDIARQRRHGHDMNGAGGFGAARRGGANAGRLRLAGKGPQSVLRATGQVPEALAISERFYPFRTQGDHRSLAGQGVHRIGQI